MAVTTLFLLVPTSPHHLPLRTTIINQHSQTTSLHNSRERGGKQRVMAEGRGSAMVGLALVMSLLLLVQYSEMAQAASFVVGGSGGWTFNLVSWPKGKHFRAGDTLVFNYNPAAHNVAVVNRAGYDACNAPRGSRILTSGKDQIKLVKGQNYFICTFLGHCQSGMKIAVTAA